MAKLSLGISRINENKKDAAELLINSKLKKVTKSIAKLAKLQVSGTPDLVAKTQAKIKKLNAEIEFLKSDPSKGVEQILAAYSEKIVKYAGEIKKSLHVCCFNILYFSL